MSKNEDKNTDEARREALKKITKASLGGGAATIAALTASRATAHSGF